METEKIFKNVLISIVYLLIFFMIFESVLSEEIPYVQLEDTNAISYINVFNYNTSIHNNLTGKQGGQEPDQFYHLSYAQYILFETLIGNNTYFPFLNIDWLNSSNGTFINITKDGVEVATLQDLIVGNITISSIVKIKNVAGEIAIKGSPMKYVAYNSGLDRYDVDFADNSIITGHAECLLLQTLSDNANGQCVVIGMIENVDTSIWSDGDHLWLNDTIGTMTDEIPSAICVQHLGIVLRSHAVLGTLYARPESRCVIDTYNTTDEMFNAVNNNSFAPFGYGDEFNKTYADTLYTNETDTNTHNTTDEIFNVVNNRTFYLLSNPYNFYNDSDFDISDYVLSSVLLGYGYYNLSDFNIVDYSTTVQANLLYAPINYNPFNQSLNTTDNVQFNNVTINESVNLGNDIEIYGNTTCAIIRAGTTYFEVCK